MTTASGVLTYTLPLTPADAESGQPFAPTSIGQRSIYVDQQHPVTGQRIEGWKWDQRIWPSDEIENNVAYIPVLWDATNSGLNYNYFQSGIGNNDDIQLEEVEYVSTSGIHTDPIHNLWIPVVKHGYYYDFEDEGYLFSDESEVVYPTYSGIVLGLNNSFSNGFNQVDLSTFPRAGIPIKARQFKWNSGTGEYDIFKEYRKRVELTGLKDGDGIRQDTYDNDRYAIQYHLIDTEEPEFTVSWSGTVLSGICPSLVFNQQCSAEVGTITSSGVPSFDSLDVLGYSTGEYGQQFRLTYSPVDPVGPVRLFSWMDINSFQEWTAVPSGVSLSGNEYLLDRDLGTVMFGTESGLHNIPSAGETIGAYYYKTVQVEFEPEGANDWVRGYETNLNPINRYRGQGFLYLSPTEDDPARVILTADLQTISTNKYGPLYIGNSYAPVIATVYDSRNNLLEDIPVVFEITSSPVAGSFSNSSEQITGSTNEDGKAKVYYIPPRSVNDIGENVPHVAVDSPSAGYTTLRTSGLLIETSDSSDPDDIFVYQVYTDDPVLGLLYEGLDPLDAQAQINQYYLNYFYEEGIYGPTGLISSGIAASNSIEWEDLHRMLWNLNRPTVYEANAGKGRRMLIAEHDATAINPHNILATDGAWVPKQPERVETVSSGIYDIIFDTSTYAMPEPSGTLNSYWIVAPTSVNLIASVYSNRLNRKIYSNSINIKLEIPSYMNGLWVIDEVNNLNIEELSSLITASLEGKKLPLGFRLRSRSITLAAALDGITFLDMNDTVNPYLYPSRWSPLGCSFEVSSIV